MALTAFPSLYSGLDVPVSGTQQTETHRIPTSAPYTVLLSRIPRCSAASTAVTDNAFTTITAFRAECSLTINGTPATIIEGTTPTASGQVAFQIIQGGQYEFSPLITFHSSDAGKTAVFTYFGFMSNADSRYVVALQQAVNRLEDLPPCAILSLSTYDGGAFLNGTADSASVYVTGTRGALPVTDGMASFAGGTLNLATGDTQVSAFSDVDGYKSISIYLREVDGALALAIAESAEVASKPTTPTITAAPGTLCGAVIVQGDGTGNAGGIEAIAQADCFSLWNMAGGGGSAAVNADVTYYVATTGSDTSGDGSLTNPWATPAKALSALKHLVIADGVTLTIECDDGVYAMTSPITSLPKGFCLSGKNTYTKTMSSVQSSSGSAGAYSVVLNLDSVTNVTTNDDCIISEAFGGLNPDTIMGYWPITNVDSENNRITVTCTSYLNAPSSSVTATVTIIKTTFSVTGASGVVLTNSHAGQLTKCGIVGNNANETHGVQCNHSTVTLTAPLGIRNFGDSGIYCLNGGRVMADAIAVASNRYNGVRVESFAYVSLATAIIAGSRSGIGIYCAYNGYVEAIGSVIQGHYDDAIDVYWMGRVAVDHATILARYTAIYAGTFGQVYAKYSIISGDCSPSAGTEGNDFACILT